GERGDRIALERTGIGAGALDAGADTLRVLRIVLQVTNRGKRIGHGPTIQAMAVPCRSRPSEGDDDLARLAVLLELEPERPGLHRRAPRVVVERGEGDSVDLEHALAGR